VYRMDNVTPYSGVNVKCVNKIAGACV
jgi:hypothetical protein